MDIARIFSTVNRRRTASWAEVEVPVGAGKKKADGASLSAGLYPGYLGPKVDAPRSIEAHLERARRAQVCLT